MFYLRINKVKILNNREMLGKGEIQLMSFVTRGESGFPMLEGFFSTTDENKRKEMVKQVVESVISSRVIMPIQKFRDNQQVFFGDTGYIVYKSKTIPDDLNWMFLAIELDSRIRSNSELARAILTDESIALLVNSVSMLTGTPNPVAGAITKISTFVAKAVTEVFKNNRDDQAGLFLASFIRKEHYPNGKRDKEDVPDLTANMFLDYTIFAYEDNR